MENPTTVYHPHPQGSHQQVGTEEGYSVYSRRAGVFFRDLDWQSGFLGGFLGQDGPIVQIPIHLPTVKQTE